MRRVFFIDGVTGLRHAQREQDRLTDERQAARDRWAAFCEAWRYLGAAIVNGYGPEES